MFQKIPCCGTLIFLANITIGTAADQPAPARPTRRRRTARWSIGGIEFLLGKGQSPDGAFTPEAGPGVTAVAIAGILRHGRSPGRSRRGQGPEYLEKFVQPDGGIYDPKNFYKKLRDFAGPDGVGRGQP